MKIFLIGDSTLQYNDETTYPQVGWGQFFKSFIKDDIEVINLGKNGASTKSFIAGPRFKTLKENISNGDLLFIQFAHNDEGNNPLCHTTAHLDYYNNLLSLINIARDKNATPILLSSIPRRKFIDNKIVDTHTDYCFAMEKLSKKENVLFININKLMMNYLNLIGEEESKKYYMVFNKGLYKNYIDGLEDNTHIREEGAILVSKIIKNQLKNSFDIFKDNKYIAYCGLNCEKCEAYIATKNNDNDLRIKVAKKWSDLNKVEIKPDDINCLGCRLDGIKSPFCESLCPIRICAIKSKYDTCGCCLNLNKCEKIKMIISNNKEALNNLKNN